MPRPRPAPPLDSQVRIARSARGLSQAELAELVGVTRQSIIAIEAGRYVPNTTVALKLARALSRRVEELFRLSDDEEQADVVVWGKPAPGTTRLSLARVRGRVVGHPAPPASFEGFTSADGVLLSRPSQGRVRLLVERDALDRAVVVMGCDPSLPILARHLERREPTARIICLQASSRAALEGVASGGAHVAGTHLRDPHTGECNREAARAVLAPAGGVLVALAAWEQGFLVARGNPKGIRGVADLARRDVRLVNREPGAGSRAMLDHQLARAGIAPRKVTGYASVVHGHFAVARAVATGAADAGVGLRAAAVAFGLDFLPWEAVRFDLAIPADHLRHPGVALLLELLNSSRLKADLAAIPGYDVTQTGTVVKTVAAAR